MCETRSNCPISMPPKRLMSIQITFEAFIIVQKANFIAWYKDGSPDITTENLRDVTRMTDRTSDRAGPGRGPSLLQLGPCDTGRAGPTFRAWPVKHGPGRAGPPAWPRPAGPGQETGQGRGLRPAFLVSEDPNFTVTVRSSPLPLYSACVVYSDEYLYSLSLL